MKLWQSEWAAVIGLLAAGSSLAAPVSVQSGSYGEFSWTAQSNIVGVTSTSTVAGGGDPRYFATAPQYNGVATLIMSYADGSAFICSGALLPDRHSILTAAHCVSDGTSARPVSTTVSFYNGSDPDNLAYLNPSFSYQVTQYAVNSAYTGNVIDQNDVAVLRLDNWVDAAITSYQLFTGGDLTGKDYNVAGYGGRSTVGGALGANAGTGRLRQGDNRYDFRLGDSDFDGAWSDILGEPASQIEYTYLSDFDSGYLANDTSCLVAYFGLGLPATSKYCDGGRGANEASIAGGDSGGPGFINGMLASINSFGLTFGPSWGDVDGQLNSSFGEFNGFVPVSLHADFIRAQYVPEPASYALAGLGLLMAGVARRRPQRRS